MNSKYGTYRCDNRDKDAWSKQSFYDAGQPAKPVTHVFTNFILKINYNNCISGMVKTVISAWVIWFIYIILLETAVPEVLYQALESITMISMMIIPIGGHVLTFQAIRSNNKKILDATHNSQQAILFKREKKAFADMALYTVATLLSILPILLLLNVEKSIVSGHILFPWASVFSQLISSLNPVVQIKKNAALRQALKFAMWN